MYPTKNPVPRKWCKNLPITLWWTNIAIENGLKIVIFHSYVSSPEDTRPGIHERLQKTMVFQSPSFKSGTSTMSNEAIFQFANC